jgi:cytochrome c-type biogenesis protein CcmH/NrfG
MRASMPARFCPQCGTPAVQGAKFCIERAAALAGGAALARPAPPATWRSRRPAWSVLAFFVVGLGIWAAVLSPEPPAHGTGPAMRAVRRSAASDGTSRHAADHPVPIQLPAEVKTFIGDLAKKASAAPDDVSTWSRLAPGVLPTAQVDASWQGAERLQARPGARQGQPDALRVSAASTSTGQPAEAVALYQRYLALEPDDQTVRTALGASYVSGGDLEKAIPLFREVIAKKPDTWPAHYYLGVALDQQGDRAAAVASVKKARELAGEDSVRLQIDQTLARMGEAPLPTEAAAPRTPFQTDVEKAFRVHQIMGPRIVLFEWTTPGTGRVLVQNFPMSGMPDEVKQKFTGRLSDVLRDAAKAHPPGDPVKIDIADATSGDVMATVTPSS